MAKAAVKQRLKPLVSYNVHDEDPKVFAFAPPKGMWLIKMYATNDIERIEVEMEVFVKCELALLRELQLKEFTEIIGELSPVTDAQFTIYQKV
ncbi:hypothetical protein Axy13_025 [Achromobacter phage vB_AxyP_19-32_Axy13]|uniref:Uncharacterized protein n=1 Tax=Achromobacter phage vB_AxyP_19-32_Axy13 TaxID=2591044 RepID=A0A514CUR3_9CAUD|nr:hypothetical protein Axy13_025 [Achromobacter phage vB_AxyP_19-32_Axy13]